MAANASGAPTQQGRLLKIITPLGEDFLLLQSIELIEEISSLPTAECLVLHHEDDDDVVPTLLDVQALLGQTVTVEFLTEDGTNRYFHGMVNRCSQMGRNDRFTSYHISIVPSVWMLTQKIDSRIFQHMTVAQILEQIFADYQFEAQLGTLDLKPRNYVVQYQETDFAFASRLMEEEGIFYYFTHTEDQHKMMLCVDAQSHLELEAKPQIPYVLKLESSEDFVAHIKSIETQYNLRTGKVTLWDYTFEKPKDNFVVSQPSRFKFGKNEEAEQYIFPAGSAKKHDVIDASQGERSSELSHISNDIKRSVEFAQQVIDAQHRIVLATSNVCSIVAGHKFKLLGHPTDEMNCSYVIKRVEHSAEQSPAYYSHETPRGYSNKFECIKWGEGAAPFRPEKRTPKPMILTAQTATVVGPDGEEIYTDKFGRVKIQFNWDREGEFDQGSSCWARIAHQWAGNRWGAMFIPRIGMEVLVHFLEGDADQPIITGCVYNNDAMPAYELPKNKNLSGIKSDSTLGGEGYNEWRFDDTKGEEQIFMHGQYDMDVRIENDRRELTKNDQHLIIKNDQFEKVENDLHQIVENDHYEHIKRDRHLKVGTGMTSKEAKEVTGSQTLKVGSDQGIKIGGSKSEEVTGSMYLKGMNVVVEGMGSLTLKCGGSFVNINPGGVFIQGPMVMLNSGGAAGAGAPVAIVPPTAPKIADEAADDKPGSKMKLQERSRKRKEGKSSKEDPKKKDWIGLELLTEAGEPVAGEAYEVKTPDGKVRRGSLNSKGKALVRGIDPGNCEVTFPNLDQEAWKDA